LTTVTPRSPPSKIASAKGVLRKQRLAARLASMVKDTFGNPGAKSLNLNLRL
jgi:hypothetical protein